MNPPHTAIKEKIDSIIQNHDVVLFIKGDSQNQMCGFSATVVQIMSFLKTSFHAVNVLEDEQIRQEMKRYSDWPTFPQLYVKQEFIGGCDIMREMYESGELKQLFIDKNILS